MPEVRKTLYDHTFDPMLKQTMQIFQNQLISFWQQGRMQECRAFWELIKEPVAQTNKYLHLWGLGW